MTEAFAVLLRWVNIAHKTSLLYQNPLIMLSSETLILRWNFGTVGSLHQKIRDSLRSYVPKSRVFGTVQPGNRRRDGLPEALQRPCRLRPHDSLDVGPACLDGGKVR